MNIWTKDKIHWVHELLPNSPLYIELYGGFGAILSKTSSQKEVYNDQNSRLVNWWRVNRDYRKEFLKCLKRDKDKKWAIKNLNSPNAVDRAYAFHILACEFIYMRVPSDDILIDIIRDRTRRIQVENIDPLKLLKKVSGIPQSVTFIDSPSKKINLGLHKPSQTPKKLRLIRRVKKCQGFVALVGYKDEWDDLGWKKHTNKKLSLWYNRDPDEFTLELLKGTGKQFSGDPIFK